MVVLVAALALGGPRLLLAAIWLFSDYLDQVFGSFVWPFLGWIFLPATTLLLAVGRHIDGGTAVSALFVVLGLILDGALVVLSVLRGERGDRSMITVMPPPPPSPR